MLKLNSGHGEVCEHDILVIVSAIIRRVTLFDRVRRWWWISRVMFEIIIMMWWWCLCHVVCRFVEGRCRGHGWACPLAPTLSNYQKEVPQDMGSPWSYTYIIHAWVVQTNAILSHPTTYREWHLKKPLHSSSQVKRSESPKP